MRARPQTRRRRKRPRSGCAALAPVALRRQTQQRSGSEAGARHALAAASVSGAMTLHVPVGVVAATLAELDELRARLDRAETRA